MEWQQVEDLLSGSMTRLTKLPGLFGTPPLRRMGNQERNFERKRECNGQFGSGDKQSKSNDVAME